ncbi:MAG: 3-methyl-2-oxobutanoate hydroxymethyltransferase [Beijerinckiaceae bacterium]|jgi:3-methyl-2-oxobutanoate hydroxymethyltransferase|nr:3-methyl-2-oxobutanoate hydroxymethyltransferase [Beijerinckiaceae bacterium]
MAYLADTRPLKLGDFAKMKSAGEKIAMLTCYDASFASLLDTSGVEVLLVGDSLGNVLQGQSTTLPVTMEHMEYHTACVARGAKRAFIASDMPFGSYQQSPQQAFSNAARLMAAGAHMVKFEGGEYMAETVRFLVERGIPVCAHVGLTPQSVHQLGGYKVQGRDEDGAKRMMADAAALEQAGAAMIVLEMVPAPLAARLTQTSKTMATIGIGAGKDCDGQVLVLHDAIGVFPGKPARFVRNFMDGSPSIQEAIEAYVTAVKEQSFPAPEHVY